MARKDTGATTAGMKSAGYYDAHSEYQRRVLEAGEAAIAEMVGAVALEGIDGALAIADYGAGTGANSVRAMRTAIEAVRRRSRNLPVVAVHNDLPTSDFGALRLAAHEGGYRELGGAPIYSLAAAGSFFDQVVPDASVGIGMCSNAAHWYRRQPEVGELDGMYFSAASGTQRERLATLAAADWNEFLAARAAELAPGGRLLVQGIGTDDRGRVSAARLLDQMWRVAVSLRDRGLLAGATLARFVFPVYCRTATEAAAPLQAGEPLADRLELVSSRMAEVANPYWEQLEGGAAPAEYASQYTAFVRAFSESTLDRELFVPGARGADPEEVRDEFFAEFERATAADPDLGRYEAFILTLVFARL
jgi:gibberellin A4 carboxyl methyltransferase